MDGKDNHQKHSVNMDLTKLEKDGFQLISGLVDHDLANTIATTCEAAFENDHDGVCARSSHGHVYAARNLIDTIPMVRMFWQAGPLRRMLQSVLGDQFGLVRVLYFDKPPDRTWTLPWHKDTAIAVQDNSLPSTTFSRPTVKAGVPNIVASDEVLRRMLTLRIHLDAVNDENGPLRVVPGSHTSSNGEGIGAEHSVAIHAAIGDVLAMRPLITHSSGASSPSTKRHRRILHLEFSADPTLPDGVHWHDFVRAD